MHRLLQEVLRMCRRNQLLGIAMAGVGIGLMLTCLFESDFFCCFVGICLVIAGVLTLQKR